MMTKKTDKLIVLGIDGMDPVFTKYLLNQGELPAIKKIIAAGACREDLMLLGGMPTITPPMWTTLSTGHGHRPMVLQAFGMWMPTIAVNWFMV